MAKLALRLQPSRGGGVQRRRKAYVPLLADGAVERKLFGPALAEAAIDAIP